MISYQKKTHKKNRQVTNQKAYLLHIINTLSIYRLYEEFPWICVNQTIKEKNGQETKQTFHRNSKLSGGLKTCLLSLELRKRIIKSQ